VRFLFWFPENFIVQLVLFILNLLFAFTAFIAMMRDRTTSSRPKFWRVWVIGLLGAGYLGLAWVVGFAYLRMTFKTHAAAGERFIGIGSRNRRPA
jgi:protein-S-isoprenylcysteine O-methyltransferase Ste14